MRDGSPENASLAGFCRYRVHIRKSDQPEASRARFKGGDVRGWFYTIGLRLAFNELRRIHLGVEPAFRPAGKAHPGILVSDIRALAARLEAHGAAVTWDAGLPGFERFYCDDPFGNRLEFLEAVAP